MFTLAQEATYEEEIKKSRFLVSAATVFSPDDALAFLKRIREARATHHCWAYKIGQQYRFSDDGEPAGTAGKPILAAIERRTIDCVMVVVVRYYGGVKLGAGGLARAYGGCTAKCLQTARLKRIVPATEVKLKVGFDHIGTLYSIIDQFGARKLEEVYTATGLEIKLKINRADYQAMADSLINASAGRIELLAEC
jgi:uncharacterized YigZ family protein